MIVHQPIGMICFFATQTPDLQPLLLTMTSLKMRRDSRYMSLTYVEQLQNNTKEIVIPAAPLQVRFNCFVVPLHTNLKLLVNIKINGNPLIKGYSKLQESLASSFIDCNLWKALGYESSLEMNSDCSFMVGLVCKIFHPISNQFTTLNRDKLISVDRVNILEKVTLDIEYLTQDFELSIEELVQDFNYLFTSWIINIEYKYPMVFSFYGRHFFLLNYSTLSRTISEVFGPVVLEALDKLEEILKKELQEFDGRFPKHSLQNKSREVNIELASNRKQLYDLHQILLSNIIKLQNNEVMTEFNILNILKELDTCRYRLKVCRKFNHDYDDKDIPLKNKVYDLKVWNETKLSSYTSKETAASKY